jgi:hypothetical protein
MLGCTCRVLLTTHGQPAWENQRCHSCADSCTQTLGNGRHTTQPAARTFHSPIHTFTPTHSSSSASAPYDTNKPRTSYRAPQAPICKQECATQPTATRWPPCISPEGLTALQHFEILRAAHSSVADAYMHARCNSLLHLSLTRPSLEQILQGQTNQRSFGSNRRLMADHAASVTHTHT